LDPWVVGVEEGRGEATAVDLLLEGERRRSSGGSRRPSKPTISAPLSHSRPTAVAAPRTSTPTTQSKTTTPNVPHTPTPATPAAGGSGFLGNVASMAAGSFIGHVVADKVLGGGERQQQGPPVEGLPPQNENYANNPCAWPLHSFNACMLQNNNNFPNCQFNYDILQQCNRDPGAFRNNQQL